MGSALTFKDAVVNAAGATLSFAVAGASLAAVITHRQDENDHLLRLLLGLSRPVSGSITTLGVDLVTASERALVSLRQRVAIIHHGGGLISNLKVWENLVLPLEYHSDLSPAEIEKRGLAALQRVGYSGRLMELPGHLSLYEKRLVTLARAIVTEPDLIVYNSVLPGLRREEQKVIISIALELHRERPGRASLFVTSNPESIKDVPLDNRIVLNGSTVT